MALNYNQLITFGRQGAARNFKCRGIDFDGADSHSWTIAPVAEPEIELPFASKTYPFRLKLLRSPLKIWSNSSKYFCSLVDCLSGSLRYMVSHQKLSYNS